VGRLFASLANIRLGWNSMKNVLYDFPPGEENPLIEVLSEMKPKQLLTVPVSNDVTLK
jgi:hypothetical protein